MTTGGSNRTEIVYWFLVRAIPAGGAPDSIRQAWVGVLLPVRRPRPIEGPESYFGRNVRDRRITPIADGVSVMPDDAIRALEVAHRTEAADWWRTYFSTHPATRGLVFRRHEGELLPASYARLRFPETDAFDDV